MTLKIFTVAAAMLLNIAAAFVIFFFLLLALNGYSEGDAMWGLAAFAVLALIITILSSGIAYASVRLLLNKDYRWITAGSISTIVAAVLGAVLQLGACLVAVLVAEIVRTSF